MNTIFYGVNGMGLGHAMRTLSIISALPDCQIHVFTHDHAFDYFKKLNYPFLHKINGITFSYKNGGVDYLNTSKKFTKFFLRDLRKNLKYINKQKKIHKPKILISDFEPSISRIKNLPLISIDNQHRFVHDDLKDLPSHLKIFGYGISALAKIYVPKPNETIISTFHYDLLNAKKPNVTLTNSLFRPEIEKLKPINNNFLLVYCRDNVQNKIISSLKEVNIPIKIYGCQGKETNNIKYYKIGPNFINDLSQCKALISTAGNSLIGEARFFKKPCLIIPEPNQYEQSINAFYAQKLGIAQSCTLNTLDSLVVKNFINNFTNTAESLPNGTNKIIPIIRKYL